jgi:hypothetical protein
LPTYPETAARQRDRWRVDLVAYLEECRKAVIQGASPAHVRHRLAGMLTAVDHHLEAMRANR